MASWSDFAAADPSLAAGIRALLQQYRWFSKTRKYRSMRTSMLEGWISSGAYGSSFTRPDSISFLMSRSESSTLATYRVR